MGARSFEVGRVTSRALLGESRKLKNIAVDLSSEFQEIADLMNAAFGEPKV